MPEHTSVLAGTAPFLPGDLQRRHHAGVCRRYYDTTILPQAQGPAGSRRPPCDGHSACHGLPWRSTPPSPRPRASCQAQPSAMGAAVGLSSVPGRTTDFRSVQPGSLALTKVPWVLSQPVQVANTLVDPGRWKEWAPAILRHSVHCKPDDGLSKVVACTKDGEDETEWPIPKRGLLSVTARPMIPWLRSGHWAWQLRPRCTHSGISRRSPLL